MAIFWPAARIARSDGMVTAIGTGLLNPGAAMSLPCKYPLIIKIILCKS
jgi:hypothetical protein